MQPPGPLLASRTRRFPPHSPAAPLGWAARREQRPRGSARSRRPQGRAGTGGQKAPPSPQAGHRVWGYLEKLQGRSQTLCCQLIAPACSGCTPGQCSAVPPPPAVPLPRRLLPLSCGRDRSGETKPSRGGTSHPFRSGEAPHFPTLNTKDRPTQNPAPAARVVTLRCGGQWGAVSPGRG